MFEPNVEVLLFDEAARDDRVVVLTMGRNTRSINKTSDRELIVALDRTGEIVWQRDLPFSSMDCRRSLQDTLLVMGAHGSIVEFDRQGNELDQWSSADHHRQCGEPALRPGADESYVVARPGNRWPSRW